MQSDQTARGADRAGHGGAAHGTSQPGFELFDKQQLGASQLPAAGHLPARARGPARPDDRGHRRRQLGAGAARAAQPPGPALLRQLAAVQRGGAAVQLRQLDPNSVAASRSSSPRASRACSSTRSRSPTRRARRCGRTPTASGADGTTLSQQAANQKYDSLTEAQVGAMLTQTLGPDKAAGARSTRTVDANQATSGHADLRQEGRRAADPDPERVAQGRRRHRRRGRHGGQHPRRRPQTGGGSGSNYKNKTNNTTFGVDKTVTHTVIAPGAVKSQTRLGARRQVGARRLAGRDQVGRRRRRRPQRQARRHALGLPDRVRQAAGRHGARRRLATRCSATPSTPSSASAP